MFVYIFWVRFDIELTVSDDSQRILGAAYEKIKPENNVNMKNQDGSLNVFFIDLISGAIKARIFCIVMTAKYYNITLDCISDL